MRQLPSPAADPQYARVVLLALRAIPQRSRLRPLSAPACPPMPGLRAALSPRALLAAALVALAALPAACAGDDASIAATSARPAWRSLHAALLRRTEVGAGRIGRFIYVVGGFLASTETTAAVERYDIRGDRWTQVNSMPIAVNHPAVATLAGRLYVYGGYTDSAFNQVTAALQRYDPASDRWMRLPPSPTPRAAAALVAYGGRLYAVGGAAAGRPLRVVERFDPDIRRWQRLPPMEVAR